MHEEHEHEIDEGLTQEIIDNYMKAGKILCSVRKKATQHIKVGQKMLDIAERIEKDIIEEGGMSAFPANLSLNSLAAHYTPSSKDETVLEAGVLKVDLGVHVNGYLCDSALTLDFSKENGKLLEASQQALENALAILKPGLAIGKIGAEIENTIKKFGFKPIANLCGHGVEQYTGHSYPTIPNIDNRNTKTLEDGMCFAIEPFATTGRGFVSEGSLTEIFSLNEPKPTRNMQARKMLEFIEKNYKTLPFAERWLEKEFSEFGRKTALRELMMNKSIQTYPILKEIEGSFVSQAETTVIIHNGEILITTQELK